MSEVIGECQICHEEIRETDFGNLVGHKSDCPENPNNE